MALHFLEEDPPTKLTQCQKLNPLRLPSMDWLLNRQTLLSLTLNNEISRAFLAESNQELHTIIVDDENKDLSIEIAGDNKLNSCNLNFEVRSSGSITICITGKTDWFGLSINGTVQPNVQLSFAIVNDLVESATMLRTEDWSIARDSTLEYGELSGGGSRIKSDIRTYLKGKNSPDQNIAVNCETTRVDDHHIEIHHQSGYSSSSLSVKSACADKVMQSALVCWRLKRTVTRLTLDRCSKIYYFPPSQGRINS